MPGERHASFSANWIKREEWAENNYYKLPIKSQNADLITVNAFWNDYAQSDVQQPFLSQNFAYVP